MTPLEAAQLGLGWLALGAGVTGMLSHRASRWSWPAAALLASAWLAVARYPGLGAFLATGTLAAVAVERADQELEPDFSRLTRHLGLTLASLAAAVVVLVRLAHVSTAEAPYVFPLLAAGILALLALFAASDQVEMQRAGRLLLVTAALGWTVSTMGNEPAAVVTAALSLPLVAWSGRLLKTGVGEGSA